MMHKGKIRILLALAKLDSHGSALRYISKTLRDAGMEVIIVRYGIIDEVVKAAIEEDVGFVGLSYYSPGLGYEVPQMMKMLKENKLDNLTVIVGGIINEEERAELLEWGVKDVFTPGRPVEDIVNCIMEG